MAADCPGCLSPIEPGLACKCGYEKEDKAPVVPAGRTVSCSHCEGRGWSSNAGLAGFFVQKTKVQYSDCNVCGGKGWLAEEEVDEVQATAVSLAELVEE